MASRLHKNVLIPFRRRNTELSASHPDFYHKHVKTVRRNLTTDEIVDPVGCRGKPSILIRPEIFNNTLKNSARPKQTCDKNPDNSAKAHERRFLRVP